MVMVQGVRGPDQLRWCPCGDHQLEVLGRYYATTAGPISEDDEPIEFSHIPLCPVCQDEERRGESAGDGVGSVRREPIAA